MRADALKGHLDGMLLAALEPGPAHGFVLMAELRRRTDGRIDLESGTLYPALRRMEEAGLITGEWTTGPGRRRREYHLTDAGRRALSEKRGTWREFVTAVGALLDPVREPGPRTAGGEA